MHPACHLTCSEGHSFRCDTVGHDLYLLARAKGIAAHDTYLRDASRREAKRCRCPCGQILQPFFLPEGAHEPLLRMLTVLEYPLDRLLAANPTSDTMDMLRGILVDSLKAQPWFAYNVPILQACLNTAWKVGMCGMGIYLLAEIYERFAALVQLEEPEYLDEPSAQSSFWDGMNEEQVLAICRREPPFSWDDVEI